eukprot:CAMPEP_0114666674 /NCGR_PEP_ID=MMETSP0191-20121206/32983_1 /TAXON_ID=126664 /ORGANISM="Sorites sp." /LENGTH=314 /DNA_ID=CAMNT_0001914931 /DNA_START=74 /DNA_END=1018 /DNA_ORIENTATION=+
MKLFTFCLTIFAFANAAEWAKLGTEFVIPEVCATRAVLDPNLTCPPGWQQKGTRVQDIKDCGLENCFDKDRFSQATIQDCANHCDANGCVVFSYAPECGDENHYLENGEPTSVCTIHGPSDVTINDDHHGPNQILCERAPTEPPIGPQGPCGEVTNSAGQPGATQYGFTNEDVKNCGQLSCFSRDRFNKQTIQECFDYCDANNCYVFTWADIGGDENHPNDRVCTTHGPNDVTINDDHHGPNQVMCRNLRTFPVSMGTSRNIPPASLMSLAQKNSGVILGALGLLSLFGGIAYKKLQAANSNSNAYEEISVEEV